MKHILILTTGGTIACTKNVHGLSPTISGRELLSFVPRIKELTDVMLDVINILNMDSSNMQPEDWTLIAKTIHMNINDYDGIIVLHGTDTMAYSSSAISFMTLGCQKPIVFTGAQIPITEETSDGRTNLYDAICTACYGGLMGVYVVFNGKIMSGCCISKCDSVDVDAFSSTTRSDIGTVFNGKITIHHYPRWHDSKPQWHTQVDKRVLLWKLTPGVSPVLLDQIVRQDYRIVILEAFGIGGLPMLKNSFLPQIMQWREQGILTVVTTQCYHGGCNMSVYETGKLALNHGAICAGNITREALLTKLMWLLTITEDFQEIIDALKFDYCGEFGC